MGDMRRTSLLLLAALLLTPAALAQTVAASKIIIRCALSSRLSGPTDTVIYRDCDDGVTYISRGGGAFQEFDAAGGGGGSGTVTSIGVSVPAAFSVTASPVTTSGSIAIGLQAQTANLIWAGPANGAAATPAFRALVSDDIPTLAQAKITSLVADLAAKAASVHGHATSDVTGLDAALGGKAPTSHAHAEADVTNLVSDLAAKVPTARTISTTAPLSGGGDLSANRTLSVAAATTAAVGVVELATDGEVAASVAVQGNDARLSNARTPTAHVHVIADTTSLQASLDTKAATSHNHDGSYEPAGGIATHAAAADPHTGYQREAEKAAANGYASLDGTGKVPSAQLPPSGSDPWTYLVLAADFTTSSATAVDVTGLAFTPAANLRYQVEAVLFTRTATATVGPRPGVAWPTGLTDGVATVRQTSAAATEVLQFGNSSAAVLAPVGGVPTTTGSWPASIGVTMIVGASPSGAFRVQLASETAATNVIAKAGSFLRYRVY